VPGLSLLIVLLVIWVIVFAPLASWLARQRARPWIIWGLFGAVLGPAATALLVMAPPGRCPACGNRIVGWPELCQTCGRDLGSQPIDAAARRAATISGPIDSIGGPSLGSVVGAPLGGSDASLSSARAATTLGLRPATVSAPFSLPPLYEVPALPPASEGGPAILGSGVFVGGSESLQVGSRYLFARVGDDLHALGPVHVSPATTAARVPLADVEPSLVEDRLLLAPTAPGRGPELAFGGVRLERNVDIVHELQFGEGGAAVAGPRSISEVSPLGGPSIDTARPKKGSARVRSAAASTTAARELVAQPLTSVAPEPAVAPRRWVAPDRLVARRPALTIQAGPYVLKARVIIVTALAVGLMAAGIVSLIGR
jgi:hypothetical protein